MTQDTEYKFEAEVAQLLKLMVHSVYSNKDIFLRELVSNAADACEKLRYLAIEKPELLKGHDSFQITLTSDENAKTLIISDNGIGMDNTDLIENLGTIARSGTKAFLEGLSEKSDGSALIGQFGVGFYSAFMVADEVQVISSKAGDDKVWQWTSSGEGTFKLEEVSERPVELPSAGTVVTLKLNDDSLEYGKAFKVEEIIRAYSSHVPIPIVLKGTEVTKDEEDNEKEEAFERSLSDGGALWTKSKSDISEDEYRDFYGHVSGQFDEPASTIHYRVEGRQEYTVLLFIPSMKPFDLFNPDRKGRIKLYVRRVFISDEIDVLPAWLRFVRGIVDSEDLPLNISREILQDNPLFEAIKGAVVKRVLSELKKISEKDSETFEKVWDAFGPVIKEGLYEDMARRDDIYEIARFKTSKSDGKWRSLPQYLEDLKENQTAIYYALGDSEDAITSSPHLEGYRARDVEVLYLADPVDAFWVRTVLGFQGKPFKSITQGADDLAEIKKAEDDAESAEETTEDLAKLYTFLKEHLEGSVSDVRASSRLAESPVCLVASDGALDKQLQKILKDQPGANPGMMGERLPILEVNASHPMIKKMAEKVRVGGDEKSSQDIAIVLYGQACILDGEQPANPSKFTQALNNVLSNALGG